MEKHLQRGVKEVITEFPAIGNVLEQYGVGCVTCSVGTCLLKDVIQIHQLPVEQEIQLMERVEKAIYPERKNISYSPAPRESEAKRTEGIKYSPPLKKLVDEHTLIKSFLGLIPGICSYIESRPDIDRQLVLDCVDFIRSYADRYHHAKEEDILFSYGFEYKEIIDVMLVDHTTGRGYVKSIIEGLERQSKEMITDNFLAYRDLLTQHIKKEDEILYPWIDRSLTDTQVGELFSSFAAVDDGMNLGNEDKYRALIDKIMKII